MLKRIFIFIRPVKIARRQRLVYRYFVAMVTLYVTLNITILLFGDVKRHAVLPPSPNLHEYRHLTGLEVIEKTNFEQTIYNVHRHGLNLDSDGVVILIQVHNRTRNLKILLDSLRKVKDIEKSLLILSHDVVSSELQDITDSVNFSPLMQIFFPYSIQMHPDRFPGNSPTDCPKSITQQEAIKRNCSNANSPDIYGHFREARVTQIKHHWFWKLSFVFDKLRIMKNYKGHVLLLEEDYYVMPDLLSVIHQLHNLTGSDNYHQVLVLGNYEGVNYRVYSDKVQRLPWQSSKHNMGMAFTADLWQAIRKCAKEFCTFDDYNWDWSLQHVYFKCIPGGIRNLQLKAGRVHHLGACGFHKKSKNCDPTEKLAWVERLLEQNRHYLFPEKLFLLGVQQKKPEQNLSHKQRNTTEKAFAHKKNIGKFPKSKFVHSLPKFPEKPSFSRLSMWDFLEKHEREMSKLYKNLSIDNPDKWKFPEKWSVQKQQLWKFPDNLSMHDLYRWGFPEKWSVQKQRPLKFPDKQSAHKLQTRKLLEKPSANELHKWKFHEKKPVRDVKKAQQPTVKQKKHRVFGEKRYGGWGDPRDHKLCMSFVDDSIKPL